MAVRTVAICGNGQLGQGVAAHLRNRDDLSVLGPAARADAVPLLHSGADVVVVATTTRLADVVDDVVAAVRSGSNVIVSAEESCFPWAVDAELARSVDHLARQRGVTVLGGGVNPGFIFDALVLTLLGTTAEPTTLTVKRVVDISRFGPAVQSRLGIGFTAEQFQEGVEGGTILGHAGFPQSMAIVADALGLAIEGIERVISPLIATRPISLAHTTIEPGRSAGVHQIYTASVAGQAWYTAHFTGHVDIAREGFTPQDEVAIRGTTTRLDCTLAPGIDAQRGSSAMVANSIDRVIAAAPGWLTVVDLPPAHPTFGSVSAR